MTESELRSRWQSMNATGPAVSLQYVRHRMSMLESQARRRNAVEYVGAALGYAAAVWSYFHMQGAWLKTALVVLTLGATYSLWRWSRVASIGKLDNPAGVGDGLADQPGRAHAAGQAATLGPGGGRPGAPG